MRSLARPLVAAILVALLALQVHPAAASAGAQAPAATAGGGYTYNVSTPAIATLEAGSAQTLVTGFTLAYPEIYFDSGGNLVLAYYNESIANFARFDGTSTGFLTNPTRVTTRDMSDPDWVYIGRGPHAALNGRGEIVTAYWDYKDNGSFLADRVYMVTHNLSGAQSRAEVFIADSQSFFFPAPSVAIGVNDSIYIARETPSDDYSFAAIGLEHRAADGAPIFANLTVFNDSTTNHYPQLVADLPRSKLILAWYNDIGEERIVGLGLDGSTQWGPNVIPVPDRSYSHALGPDGSLYSVWIDAAGDVRGSKFDTNGTLLVNRKLIATGAGSWARVPRAAVSPAGDLFVAWEEDDGAGASEVRATVLRAVDLSTLQAPSWVSDDAEESQMPHLAFAPDGTAWLAWRVVGQFGGDDRIDAVSLRPRAFSFEAQAPAQDVTVYRGERAEIPLRVRSIADFNLTYFLSYSLSSVRGPWNWTVEFIDAATGTFDTSYELGANGTADITLRVTPPVWDPPGNGLFLIVNITETKITSAGLALVLNLTSLAGHGYAMTPADQNATGLPGSTAQLFYQVRNTGAIEESGVPFTLTQAPPPGWSAVISPAAFTALPGETQVVTLTITSPAAGTSADLYCARLRIQHAVDVFALASSGFCARVALVTEPKISPPSRSLLVDPATTVPLSFTLENAGNSAVPVVCHIEIAESLPSGWSILGNPAALALPRNSPTAVPMSVVVPSSAPGGLRLDLTARATCDGGTGEKNASVTVNVRPIHAIQWRAPGTSVQTNATGDATLSATGENVGNVVETLSSSALVVPRGWTIAIAWTVGGVPAEGVAPAEIATALLSVRAPPRELAGTYRFTVSLAAGDAPAYGFTFAVQVAATFGIGADFGPSAASASASEVVSFLGAVTHLGNAQDIYQLKVAVASTQFWLWTAEFIGAPGDLNSSVSGGYLALSALAEGTLYVYLTAPREPFAGDFQVTITLTNPKGATATFVGVIGVRLPDLRVAIEGVPQGEADPTLVGAVTINVTCTGGVFVDNATLRVVVDGALVFDSPVGPFCEPGWTVFEITVSVGPGLHAVTATVDPEQAGANPLYGFILESDEQNNAATRTFAVLEAPPPPPPTNTSAPGLSVPSWVLGLAAALGAGGVGAVVALRQRRDRQRESGEGAPPDEP